MSDKLLTLSAAAKLLPSTKQTLYRWVTEGVRDGKIVLQAKRIGERWYTRADWIQAFLDACAAPRPRAPRPARNGSRGPRSIRAVDPNELERKLIARGLMARV